jgi:hypothetical protein
MRNVHKILAEKPEGKRPFERPRSIWKDNNIFQRYNSGGCGLDSSGLGWDQWWALLNMGMNLRVP